MTPAAPEQAAAVGKGGASVSHSLVRRRTTPCGAMRSSSGPAGLSCGITTGFRGSSSSSCSSTSSSRGGRSPVAQLRRANAELLRTNSDLERSNGSLRAKNADLERQLDADGFRFLQALAEMQTEVQTLAEQREVLQNELLVACQDRVKHDGGGGCHSQKDGGASTDAPADASMDAPADAMAAMQQELQDALRQFEEIQEEHDEELRAVRSENDELRQLLEKQNADMELQLAEAEQARDNVTQSMIEEGMELQARIEKLVAEKEALSLLVRVERPPADGEAIARVTTPNGPGEDGTQADSHPLMEVASQACNSRAPGERPRVSCCRSLMTVACCRGCCRGLRRGNGDAGPCGRFSAAVVATVTAHPAVLLLVPILLALNLLLASLLASGSNLELMR